MFIVLGTKKGRKILTYAAVQEKDITSKINVQSDFFKKIVLSVLITQEDLHIKPSHITFAVSDN